MIFINTRPKNRATLLTNAMQDKGLTVFNLPLLTLEPIAISKQEQQYHQVFYTSPNHYQALVVVSPTAARMGLVACPQGFIPKCPVIAVGHKTAQVLGEAGWQVRCPDEYSNEGMMRMQALSVLGKGDQVLIWRGQGGRRLLVNYLQQNSVVVDAIAWYLRRCPDDLSKNFGYIQQQLQPLMDNPSTNQEAPQPIVLVSSGEAFKHWCQLFAQIKNTQLSKDKKNSTQLQLADFQYLTFGKRLTETLTDLKLACVRIEHLDVDEVWRGIELLNNKTN